MFKKLALGLLLLSTPAAAGEYYLLGMEHFDMRYQEFKHQRDPYAPEYTESWNYRAATHFRYNILGVLYHDNYIHTETIQSGQVKTVGWQWTIGLRIHPNVDIFQEHHSRHVMEDFRPTKDGKNQFPVEDSYGIKLTIVDDPLDRKFLFGGKK